MEKYSKAVSAMYSQFKQREAHQMEKYVGRHAIFDGRIREVVGYSTWPYGLGCLIVGVSEGEGWGYLTDNDVIIKKCEGYSYASTNSLID